MHLSHWTLLFTFSMIGVIEAGVKIEISRVKDQQKISTHSANVYGDDANEIENTETTTLLTSTMGLTTKSTTDNSNIVKITKSYNSSTNFMHETTTMSSLSPSNVTVSSMITPVIQNTIANDINPNTNMTLASEKNLNYYLSEFTRRQLRRRFIPYDYYCPCDLKINFCDINCCCDVDCLSEEIIQSLKCNERDWSIHDYEESSELQLCSQTRYFSLFCIVENTRRRKQMRKQDFKVHDVNIISAAQHKWPNQYDHQIAESDYREHYIYSDPILVWDDSLEEIQFLDVPQSFDSTNCHVRTTLKYLVNSETKCVQTLDEHYEFISDFQTRLKSVKILKFRKPLDTPPIILKDMCSSIQNVNDTVNCTYIEIYHCIKMISMRSCRKNSNSTFTTVLQFDENFISNFISIQVHHNFTNILNVTVFFVWNEFNSDSSAHIVQRISIDYLEMNETFSNRDVHQISGNIGYLFHKPIIITKFVRLNETIGENVSKIGYLTYFHNETNCTNNDHYLKVPAIGVNGDCEVNHRTFQIVNFGENLRIKCNAILILSEFNGTDITDQSFTVEQNNTYICRAFQRKIFDYLLYHFELENDNVTIYNHFKNRLSEMGNPRNDTMHWIDFKVVHPPNVNDIVASIVGNDASEFVCTNMVLGVLYEFFYGTMMVGKISNQELIKMAQIQFGKRVNLKFKLEEDILKVPLHIDVMFYDFSRFIGNGARISYCFNVYTFIFITLALFVPRR